MISVEVTSKLIIKCLRIESETRKTNSHHIWLQRDERLVLILSSKLLERYHALSRSANVIVFTRYSVHELNWYRVNLTSNLV